MSSNDELERQVADVRGFNRYWTGVIHVLNQGLLDSPYSLTEGRVLFELAQAPSLDLAELRRALDLDASYLSRIVARFKADALVEASASPDDGRRQVLHLTPRGREVFAVLDERSASENRGLLERCRPADRAALVEAMRAIRRIVGEWPAQQPSVALRPLRPGDLGWVVARHGALYAEEYGWDATVEGFIARIAADYAESSRGDRQSGWIAELEGEPVGSVLCARRDDDTAQLRLLLVEPRARGLGIGRRLVDECVAFARAAGYARIVLWTNDVLVSARRIYEAAGFTLEDERPHRSFGRDLVGQHWALALREPAPLAQ